MNLKNNLYRIVNHDPDTGKFDLELDSGCFIYKAHFPEQPVTPGVCIIQTATELLEEILHHKIELKTVTNAKFLSVINPKDTPRVSYVFKKITTDDENGAIKATVTVTDNETVYSKLSLTYSK